MDITIKEPIHILCDNKEHIIRPGTIGVERNRIVFFYDTTKTSAIGFSRDYCLENSQTFQVARTLMDREILQKDVLRILDKFSQKECNLAQVYEYIKAL